LRALFPLDTRILLSPAVINNKLLDAAWGTPYYHTHTGYKNIHKSSNYNIASPLPISAQRQG